MELLKILMSVILIGFLLLTVFEITIRRKYTFTAQANITEPCKYQRDKDCFVGKKQVKTSLLPKNNQGIRDRADWAVVIEKRKQLLRQQCQKFSQNPYWTNLIPSGELWTYEDINYCVIYKTGSTFWKRAFKYLAHDYKEMNGPILKPSDISRFQAQRDDLHHITRTQVKLSSTTGKSFMFARNPYSRLWSAYIDKFVLPNFWASLAVKVAKLVRSNVKTSGVKCVRNITFEEFLRHITVTTTGSLDPHWKPVHRLCDPCHVTYDVIGKQETFATDTAYIVVNFDIDKIILENIGKKQRVKGEVEMLVRFNFDLEERNPQLKTCFDRLDVAKRLWFAFQCNGYIHRSIAFPLKTLIIRGFLGHPKQSFLDTVFKTIDLQTNAMKRDLMNQKITMMMEAYRNIPSNILGRLKSIYKYDFLLFQYDPEL